MHSFNVNQGHLLKAPPPWDVSACLLWSTIVLHDLEDAGGNKSLYKAELMLPMGTNSTGLTGHLGSDVPLFCSSEDWFLGRLWASIPGVHLSKPLWSLECDNFTVCWRSGPSPVSAARQPAAHRPWGLSPQRGVPPLSSQLPLPQKCLPPCLVLWA